MSDFDRGLTRPSTVAAPDMSVDAGLRAFMLGVYNKVALGLVLSASLAWVTGTYKPVSDLLFRQDVSGRLVGYTVLQMLLHIPIVFFLCWFFARYIAWTPPVH